MTRLFFLGWLLFHTLLHCDQASVEFEENLTSKVTAFGAHKIGDLQKPDASADAARGSSGGGTSSAAATIAEPISSTTHKLLHTALGTGLGALTAAATEQDIARGAASGGLGALVGTLMTDAMIDDKDAPVTAQRMTQMSDLIRLCRIYLR